MSVLSFPERGPWGSAKYPGNCSGHVYRTLFEQLKPAVFVDPTVGSGTSLEVAKDMGIEAYGFDLQTGFDAVTMSLLQAVGKPADFVCAHPPYAGMITYSGRVWGEANPADLSRCNSLEQYHDRLHMLLLNERDACRANGHYGLIIGDWRKRGRYYSLQAEALLRMPTDELVAVLIKEQHQVASNKSSYKLDYPRILHEYVLLWRKRDVSVHALLQTLAQSHQRRLRATWKAIVAGALRELGGEAPLKTLYEWVASAAPERLKENGHYEAKVRQTLNQNPELFQSSGRGVWQFA